MWVTLNLHSMTCYYVCSHSQLDAHGKLGNRTESLIPALPTFQLHLIGNKKRVHFFFNDIIPRERFFLKKSEALLCD